MWAGASSLDITPPVGIAMGGWSNQVHEVSESNHESLRVETLVIGGEGTPVTAIAVLDVCVLTDPEAGALRAAISGTLGLPVHAVRVSATHSHSSPASNEISGIWIRGGREKLGPYLQWMEDQVTASARSAGRAMRPAVSRHARGESAVPIYRRVVAKGKVGVGAEPDQQVSKNLDVLRLDDKHGEPIATVIALGAHPTVLAGGNRAVSPDFPGVARAIVESATGAPCLFLQGAAGDVGPRMTFTDSVEDVERLGSEVGHLALSLRERAGFEPISPPTASNGSSWLMPPQPASGEVVPQRVDVLSVEVDLPIKQDLGNSESLSVVAAQREDELYAARLAGAPDQQIRDLTIAAKRAYMDIHRVTAVGTGPTTPVEIHAIGIGDVILTGVPVEPFWRSAATVEAGSPYSVTLFSGYTNGYKQYLPRVGDHRVGGYEVEMTPFAPGAAELLEKATIAMVSGMWSEHRSAPTASM